MRSTTISLFSKPRRAVLAFAAALPMMTASTPAFAESCEYVRTESLAVQAMREKLLKEAFRRADLGLTSLVDGQATLRRMSDSASGVGSTTFDIEQAINDLATRTETQAAALEDTMKSTGEIVESTNFARRTTKNASDVVARAETEASESNSLNARATEAMKAIEDSSNRITSITSLVHDIAFQTNILSLNAGVEAARAGPSGRGFAVVASEVRSLAQRSADAAEQISNLIEEAVEQVKTGGEAFNQSAASLERMVGAVKEANQMIADVKTASEAAGEVAAVVRERIKGLEGATQRNAAMSEETNAAASGLAGEAQSLQKVLSEFEPPARDAEAAQAA